MKIAFHTLGCKVNQYETESMMERFRDAGHEIVEEREPADVYVINTCTVTSMADRKSRQFARRMKKQNPDSVIVVTGCYSQIRPEEVAAVEGVDIVTGTADKGQIPAYVEEFLDTGVRQLHVKGYEELDVYEETGTVTGSGNRTRAYIKIQEGCNRFCSYCVIPYARGRIRSRNLENIVAEAQSLIGQGYKEIVLTGINTALYDMEGRSVQTLPEDEVYGVEKAIAAINALEGDFRIRLSSLEPAVVNAAYVKRLMKYEKLCHYVHLSCQSGSSRILEAMNRPYTREDYLEIVKVLRDFDPRYGISTDIIVGFPGEREADFEDSLHLLDDCGFVKTHVFKYSKRPFTKAAELPGHVSPQIKGIRSDRLQQAGKATAQAFFAQNLGQRIQVLVEEYDETTKTMRGYSDNYIEVYVNCKNRADFERYQNTFVTVRLTETVCNGMAGVIDET